MNNYFVCNNKNELYELAKKSNDNCIRVDTVDQVFEVIKPNSFVYILCDDYPQKKTVVSKEQLNLLKQKNSQTFIEYPRDVYGLKLEGVVKIDRERIVKHNTLSIGQNNCQFALNFLVKEQHVLYSFSKVAGFKKAVYGLNYPAIPYIFTHPEYENITIISGKISTPVTSRFKPVSFFKTLYKEIFSLTIDYEESVRTTFNKEDKIDEDDIKNAIDKSTEWFSNYMLTDDYHGVKVYEGFSSELLYDGKQTLASAIRNDCTGEASLVFAMDYLLNKKGMSKIMSDQLMAYIFQDGNQELDMSKDEGGFIKWYGMGDKIYYTDDNARLLLGSIVSSNIIKKTQYDEGMIKCILAFMRSMPEKGIHINSLRYNDRMVNMDYDYRDIKDKMTINYSPHYVSYIWAVFLLTYELTGDEELLTISKKGILEIMSKYPEQIKWTNGIMAEVSRMILPLALLYRYDKDKEIKKYLDMMYDECLKQTDEHGCMLEKMILVENGKYPPPKNNDDYGKYEAPVIHENGDQACDLLYSQNFAYLGLHEAYHATGEEKYATLVNKMTSFLVKIQNQSEKHEELDGTWMRSFDPDMWEYYGSGADAGWAALCVESGWTNSWINIVMSLGMTKKSMVDYINNQDEFSKLYYKIKDTIK